MSRSSKLLKLIEDCRETFSERVSMGEAKGEYHGRTVTLNTPVRAKGGRKKFYVYVKGKDGRVIKVHFGDPDMKIRVNEPDRRASFRARHKCDTDPPDITTPRYWSCQMW